MSRATLEVTVKSVYGIDKIYPANETAQLFAEIAGTKTLSTNVIAHAEALGFAIVEIHTSKVTA